jgi:hypothetical protein
MQAATVDDEQPAQSPSDGVPCTIPTIPHASDTASPAPQSKRARRAHRGDSSGVHRPPRSPLDMAVPDSPVPPAHEPLTSPTRAAHTAPNSLATPRLLEQRKAAEWGGSAHTPMRTHVHTSASPDPGSPAAFTSLVTPARSLSEKSSLNNATPASGWRRRGGSRTAVASALSPALELITPGRHPASVDIVPGTPCSATDATQTVGLTPSSLWRRGAAPAPPHFHDVSSAPGFRLPLGGADSPLARAAVGAAAGAAATAPAPLGAIAAEHLASISSDRAVRSAMVAGPSGSDQCAVLHVVVRPTLGSYSASQIPQPLPATNGFCSPRSNGFGSSHTSSTIDRHQFRCGSYR